MPRRLAFVLRASSPAAIITPPTLRPKVNLGHFEHICMTHMSKAKVGLDAQAWVNSKLWSSTQMINDCDISPRIPKGWDELPWLLRSSILVFLPHACFTTLPQSRRTRWFPGFSTVKGRSSRRNWSKPCGLRRRQPTQHTSICSSESKQRGKTSWNRRLDQRVDQTSSYSSCSHSEHMGMSSC